MASLLVQTRAVGPSLLACLHASQAVSKVSEHANKEIVRKEGLTIERIQAKLSA